jgi:hypothetical protein
MEAEFFKLFLVALPLCVISSPANADAPSGRYVVSNGTVFDAKTKLQWQQSASTSMYTIAAAKAFCTGSWRLPTVKELFSIVDDSRVSADGSTATIDPVAFPGSPARSFWSATSVSGGGWIVDFSRGTASTFGDSPFYVRCVLR